MTVPQTKMDVRGKKLLILGATSSELILIRRAHELGVYVIVTDNQTDHSISVAKDYADEAWDISWADIDALESKCRECGVDGVTAGWSEFRVENMIRLCERLGLPSYCTEEQLEITRNKRAFKNECILNGVPVVKEYATVEDVDSFPVIIKPVDRAGSIGISVANNAEELRKAYDYAMSLSVCKDAIIETFITDAVKFDSYYAVIHGKIYLLSTDDVINAANNGFERVVQSGWVLPSRRQAMYEKNVDASVQRMIRHMGIQNGTLFFSGFANDAGYFAMFETGFRLDGGYLQSYFAQKGWVDYSDIYIYHALMGDLSALEAGEDRNPELKCATVNIYMTEGTVSAVEGFEKIGRMDNCSFSMQRTRLGEKCVGDKAILTKAGMYYFCSESPEILEERVTAAYDELKILDEQGHDMIYDRIASGVVGNWWA